MSNATSPVTQAAEKHDRNRGLSPVLRQLRRDAKATQADIAAALELERTSICNIESGLQAMTIEKLHDFAERIGVDVKLTFSPKRRSQRVQRRELVLGEVATHE